MGKIAALIVTVLLALVGVWGDYFIKLAGGGKRFVEPKWFILGMGIYAVTAFGWLVVMKEIKLTTLGVFYALSTILFLTVVGVVFFHEQLNGFEVLGVVFAVAALVLLGRFA